MCLRKVAGDGIKNVTIKKKKTHAETIAANYHKFPSIEAPKFSTKREQVIRRLPDEANGPRFQ